MKSMQEYADAYQRQHRGKGTVSSVTDYSFKYTTLPLKDTEQPKSHVVMLSYFWEKVVN